MLDLSLFPTKEEWGSGDEAIDNKLSIALIKATDNLTFSSISEFYFLAISLKLRTYNPSFLVTIELMAKGLFYFLDSNECIDHSIKKMKGAYSSKEKNIFDFKDIGMVKKELLETRKCRYKNQIDFSINLQDPTERNPFVRSELNRSIKDLSTKIIFKEFKNYLNEELRPDLFSEPLFVALRGGRDILVIEKFAEIWYHEGQIFSLLCNGDFC